MSEAAHVRSVQTLEDLDSSLGRFAGEAQEALTAADLEIRRTLEWLQERLQHWSREVERRRQEMQAAQVALQRCLNSGYTDRDGRYHAPSCGAYEAALLTARRRLQEAEAELRTVQHWLGQLERAVQTYRRQAQRLKLLATHQTPRAQAFLKLKRDDLERYRTLSPPEMARALPLLIHAAATYNRLTENRRRRAVRHAREQEIELVKSVGRGTREWSKSSLRKVKAGTFPKGYHGHHINSVSCFPELAGQPDNITFLTTNEHKRLHGKLGYSTSGRMYNRKSLMVEWAQFKRQ